jgi:hypothetical protein
MNKLVWSYSALKDYEGCARRYHRVRILKEAKQEKTEQILYGEELHKACELYVTDNTPLPSQFLFVKPTVDALLAKAGRKFAEHKMGVREDATPCGFFDDAVHRVDARPRRVWFVEAYPYLFRTDGPADV